MLHYGRALDSHITPEKTRHDHAGLVAKDCTNIIFAFGDFLLMASLRAHDIVSRDLVDPQCTLCTQPFFFFYFASFVGSVVASIVSSSFSPKPQLVLDTNEKQ